MKLDRTAIEKIYKLAQEAQLDRYDPYISLDYFDFLMKDLELVFKSGDSSQSILVLPKKK